MRRVPKTSVKWQILDYYLKDHPDRELVAWCVDGFRYGFTLGLTKDPQIWPDPPNSKRVLQNPDITWQLVKDEMDKDFILGPFQHKPLPTLFCVPINIIEKTTSSGLYRLIQDFSYPYNNDANGVNAMVPKENKKVSYSGIDDVARMALQLGPNSWAMQIDIKHAFKCLPLHPSQWQYTGFKFRGAYFIQTQTPFGASASCLHFEKVARLLRWIIQKQYQKACITNYLDDFWLTQKSRNELQEFAALFTRIIEGEIGFPISHNKTLGPATCLEFVGLTADLTHLRILLPEDKRQKALCIINKLILAHNAGSFVTVKDLECCTGILNYACQAIPIGRPWLQSCYALQWVAGDHTSDRTISALVSKDLQMFKSFLEHTDYFVKSVPFLDRLGIINSALEIKADASGNPKLGFGCYLPHTGEWFGKSWKETSWFQHQLEAARVIYQLELFAITLAFKVFAPALQGRVVFLRSDNIAVVNSINNMSSQMESGMELLRELTLTCMSLQVFARAVHIPGVRNTESDQISRGKVSQFLEENPRSQGG